MVQIHAPRTRRRSACLQCALDKPIVAYHPTFLTSAMEFGPVALRHAASDDCDADHPHAGTGG